MQLRTLNGSRRVYLIGMMGSGKSYWAKRLGRQLGLPAYDLDQLLEIQAGKSVQQQFAGHGEEAFRKAESVMLREGVPAENFVLACGGGTPCFFDNMLFMKENGLVIWLKPGYDELVKRLAGGVESRPVLEGIHTPDELKTHLRHLTEKRRTWYELADIIVEDDLPTLATILKKIEDYKRAT